MRYSAILYIVYTSKMEQKKKQEKSLNCFELIGTTLEKLKYLILMWAFVFLSLYLYAYKYIFICVCVYMHVCIFKNANFLKKCPSFKN